MGWRPDWASVSCVALGKLLNLSVPQAAHLLCERHSGGVHTYQQGQSPGASVILDTQHGCHLMVPSLVCAFKTRLLNEETIQT